MENLEQLKKEIAADVIKQLFDNVIEFTKVRDVKSPTRANFDDAGVDFYVPSGKDELNAYFEAHKEQNARYAFADTYGEPHLIILPQGRVNIPSGIKVNIHNPFTYLKADNKSGIASKKGLIVGADIIDFPYRGEVHINVINASDEPARIKLGTKLVQMIQHFYVPTEYKEISNEEFNALPPTSRGACAFGSSGLE